MAHSERGFSGQSRIIACPGSPRMQRGLEDSSSDAAELGTAVHEMGELALSFGLTTTASFKGRKFNGFKVTDKMIDAADFYLDHVYEITKERPNAVLLIEKRVKLSSIDDSQLWGTLDLGIIDYENRWLLIGDYKNGWGIVDVMPDQYVFATNEIIKGNAQLIGYLIALCDTLNLWKAIDTFEIMVVQPNKGHIDGECRRVSVPLELINKWWHVYNQSHWMSMRGDAPTNAGGHCKYCRARATCGTNLKNIFSKFLLDCPVPDADVDDLIALSEMAGVMRTTMERVDQLLVDAARKGTQIPNKKLVRSIVRAKVTDENELVEAAAEIGITSEKLYNQKLKSKTELKTILGDELAHKFFQTPERGYTLVDMSDTRMAVMGDRKPSAKGKFKRIQ